MKVKVIGSTKAGYCLPIDEALDFAGKAAGICYMPDTFDSILNEDIEKTKKRVQGTLKSGHHSVYDHPTYNILFEDIPKILAMVLNNEGFYTTSEKSARYTKMNPSEQEKLLYYKWIDIFKEKIQGVYPQIKKNHQEKLAQENARYLISVFTPTTMEYTVSLRQLSGIISMMKRFNQEADDTCFNKKLKYCMSSFIDECREFDIPYLNNDTKNKKLSLFDSRKNRKNEFGENYSINYYGSFAQLAQAHRHRTLDYRIRIPEQENDLEFYIPPIIRAENNNGDSSMEYSWIRDSNTVVDVFPQGMLIQINERGTYENFMLKAKEIAQQTGKTLIEYISNLGSSENEIKEYLEQYVTRINDKDKTNIKDKNNDNYYIAVPRCKFPDYKCSSPCIWGVKALERTI